MNTTTRRRVLRRGTGIVAVVVALVAAHGGLWSSIAAIPGEAPTRRPTPRRPTRQPDQATLKKMASKVLNTEARRERAAARDPAGDDDLFEALDGRPAQDLQQVPRQGRLPDRPGHLHAGHRRRPGQHVLQHVAGRDRCDGHQVRSHQADPPLRQRRGRPEVPRRLALGDRSGKRPDPQHLRRLGQPGGAGHRAGQGQGHPGRQRLLRARPGRRQEAHGERGRVHLQDVERERWCREARRLPEGQGRHQPDVRDSSRDRPGTPSPASGSRASRRH